MGRMRKMVNDDWQDDKIIMVKWQMMIDKMIKWELY